MRHKFLPAALLLAFAVSAPTWPAGHSAAEAAVVKKHHRVVRPRRHHWTYRRATTSPSAESREAERHRQNDCSNNDCRGINSSNGIGGSGGF